MSKRPSYAPPPAPAPTTVSIGAKMQRNPPKIVRLIESAANASDRSAFHVQICDSSFVQTDLIMHKSLPQHGCKLVTHFPSPPPPPSPPPLPPCSYIKPFSFSLYVSPLSVSKYPTQLGLWGTTRTATWPTTTTGLGGARAPTAGQRTLQE
ncbi:hypothetical protein fugu_007824 [Takifugu bimaculatus]|uniref:Uncharacterized protein n=1 Tax=Takifugu bimaculatus TaxID=433685 RepID=A0A4Z2AZH8_9TELE|nr:hypothetical protein fugu_007824 [Takifugu bimaculatus]